MKDNNHSASMLFIVMLCSKLYIYVITVFCCARQCYQGSVLSIYLFLDADLLKKVKLTCNYYRFAKSINDISVLSFYDIAKLQEIRYTSHGKLTIHKYIIITHNK